MIEKLIKEKSGSIDIEDMKKIQSDEVDIYAIKKKAALINLIGPLAQTAKEKEGLKQLERWSGEFHQDLKEPTLFSMIEH